MVETNDDRPLNWNRRLKHKRYQSYLERGTNHSKIDGTHIKIGKLVLGTSQYLLDLAKIEKIPHYTFPTTVKHLVKIEKVPPGTSRYLLVPF